MVRRNFTKLFRGSVHCHRVQHGTTVTTGVFNLICRCRLAVWRQLPKLISAGPTPVTCSTWRRAFGAFLLIIRRRTRRVRASVAMLCQRQTPVTCSNFKKLRNLRDFYFLRLKIFFKGKNFFGGLYEPYKRKKQIT